jgi:hypothetical protein
VECCFWLGVLDSFPTRSKSQDLMLLRGTIGSPKNQYEKKTVVCEIVKTKKNEMDFFKSFVDTADLGMEVLNSHFGKKKKNENMGMNRHFGQTTAK